MNKSRVKRLVLALVVLIIFAQFVQPRRTNPAVVPSKSLEAHVQVPEQVQVILRRACNDCHSSDTVWPWYSHIAPVSWLVVDDVNQGRSHINFQDWEAQVSPSEGTEHLALICKEVREAAMPPLTYRLMHKESRLSADDIKTLCTWSQTFGTPPETQEKGSR